MERWPEQTAVGDGARCSHVRARLRGEMSYTLMERYDVAHETDSLLELINWLLAHGHPRLVN
jgi:hypothetical protein